MTKPTILQWTIFMLLWKKLLGICCYQNMTIIFSDNMAASTTLQNIRILSLDACGIHL